MSPRIPIGLLAAQSDRRLVELVAEGHERAFEVLVKRYRRQLTRYCRRMGLADSRAEDVLQHAFLQAWLALERGVEVRAPKPWLYRIVHNSAVNVMLGAREEPAELIDGAHADSYESGFESGLVARQTLSDVAALPPMQREAMLMSAVDGRSHEEVADALGITNGAVRGLLYRARSTLRDAAAALIPQPLVGWAAGYATRGAPTAERLAQLSAQGGGAGAGGMLVKTAAMTVTAGVLAAGVAVVPNHGHTARRATAASQPPVIAPVGAATVQSPAPGASQATVVSARRAATSTRSANGGTRLAIGSAPSALISPRHASSTVGRSAPASSAPSPGASSVQHSASSQPSSVGLAASAPPSSSSTPATSPPQAEPATPPPTTVKEESPPGTGGSVPDDGSEESPEVPPPVTKEPETPPKVGEKPKTDN
jgi:RNA polymerase sigma factor (sigma-70 family)